MEVRGVGDARRAGSSRDRAARHPEQPGRGRAARHAREAAGVARRARRHAHDLLETMQAGLLARATAFREAHTTHGRDLRRVPRGDGWPPRLRRRALGVGRGARGAGEGRDPGDAPQLPFASPKPDGSVHVRAASRPTCTRILRRRIAGAVANRPAERARRVSEAPSYVVVRTGAASGKRVAAASPPRAAS